jgi:hypothetical protein
MGDIRPVGIRKSDIRSVDIRPVGIRSGDIMPLYHLKMSVSELHSFNFIFLAIPRKHYIFVGGVCSEIEKCSFVV